MLQYELSENVIIMNTLMRYIDKYIDRNNVLNADEMNELKLLLCKLKVKMVRATDSSGLHFIDEYGNLFTVKSDDVLKAVDKL